MTARETQAAFDKIVANRISAAQPKTLPAQPGAPTYIKYTPAQQARSAAVHHLCTSLPFLPLCGPHSLHHVVHTLWRESTWAHGHGVCFG